MADESTTPTTAAEPTAETREEGAETDTETREESAEPTAEAREDTPTPTAEGGPAAFVPAGPEGGPVPGDPSTEPVATAGQSHVAGRVGPATIAEDPAAPRHTPEGVEQVSGGTVAEDLGYFRGGPVPETLPEAVLAAQAIDSDAGTTSAAPAGTSEPTGAAPSGASGVITPDGDEQAPTDDTASRTSTSSGSG